MVKRRPSARTYRARLLFAGNPGYLGASSDAHFALQALYDLLKTHELHDLPVEVGRGHFLLAQEVYETGMAAMSVLFDAVRVMRRIESERAKVALCLDAAEQEGQASLIHAYDLALFLLDQIARDRAGITRAETKRARWALKHPHQWQRVHEGTPQNAQNAQNAQEAGDGGSTHE